MHEHTLGHVSGTFFNIPSTDYGRNRKRGIRARFGRGGHRYISVRDTELLQVTDLYVET